MKTKLFRLMAAVTVLSLLLPTTLALAAPEPPPELQYVSDDEVSVYIVRLTAAPLASYRGGLPGLMATNPQTLGETRLDVNSPNSVAYLDHLAGQRQQFVAGVEAALNRSPKITAEYQYAFNGMAVELTSEEAAEVTHLPGVVSVEKDYLMQPATDAGPEWIGAKGIWDGSTTGGLPGTKGEGVIVGIIDTGINMDHPSFADVGGDGYDHTNPFGSNNYVGLCATEPGSYQCNDKLIGAWDYADGALEFDGPEDQDGHGSHTASTAAGNVVYSATIEAATTVVTAAMISGVAPHANIIAYDACDDDGCANSAMMAAADQAVADGVDVINYSIGGGPGNPWTGAGAMNWLGVRDAGVFVATSAGNDGPAAETMGSPANSPWMLSVGASTHNRKFSNSLTDMAGGGTPPADIEGKSITSGFGPAQIVYAGDYGDALCLLPFAAGTFSGEIVVCDRGEIARVDKGANVLAGGAGGYVLANDAANGNSLNADSHVLPAVHITYADAVVLKAWLDAGEVQTATIAGTSLAVDDDYADVMAGFSSRGPNPDSTLASSIIKPDVVAPGVDIFAAYKDGIEYASIGGTSMSSPHAAGAGALLRALNPDWSPAEIQSALTLSAWDTGLFKEDEVTEADPFDRGAGRIDLSAAGQVGLVLDETTANYEDANPDAGGDPATLNLATLGNGLCLQQCTWTRDFRNVLDVDTTYTVTFDVPTGMTMTATPMTFTVPAYGMQSVDFEADASSLAQGEWAFARAGLETDATLPEFTVDWEEGFEASPVPTGWMTYTLGATDDPGFISTGISHYGNYAVGHFDDNTDGVSDSWLVTPVFTPTADTVLAMWQLTYWDAYYGYHGIWVSDGSGDPNDGEFVALAELSDGTAGYWERVTQSLGAYDGSPIYVAFRYQGDYSDWWLIDDVMVGEVSDTVPVADLHLPVAVRPTTGILPNLVEIDTRRNAGSTLIEDLQGLEITDLTVDLFGFAEADLQTFYLLQDPTHDVPEGFFDDLSQVYMMTTTVGSGDMRLVAEIVATTSPDLDMVVGRDVDGDGPELGEIVCQSATGGAYEYCDVSGADLMAGEWWVLVMNWQESANAPDRVVLATAVVPGTDAGNMAVTGPDVVPELTDFDLRLFWDTPGMVAGDRWYGAFAIGTDAGNPGAIGTIPVNINRFADDVSKAGVWGPDGTITYTISILPDITGMDMTYTIIDTLPEGTTYVPGSAYAPSGSVIVGGGKIVWGGQVIPERRYFASTSLEDPLCTMPLANSGSYVDLEGYGFLAEPGFYGDNVVFENNTYGGGAFSFYGDAQTKVLSFSDDGFVSLGSGSIVSGTQYPNAPIPDAADPNALMAMLWGDMEIIYEAGTGENNRGATTNIQLTTGGVPSSKLLEFDDVQLAGDPTSQIDYEMLIREHVDDAAGVYEVIYAYDNLTGDFTSLVTGTIGVEDYNGAKGTEYAYDDAGLQTLQDGMAICFDYAVPVEPLEITYRVTVDDPDTPGIYVNALEHTTDDPGAKWTAASYRVLYGYNVTLILPIIYKH